MLTKLGLECAGSGVGLGMKSLGCRRVLWAGIKGFRGAGSGDERFGVQEGALGFRGLEVG